MSMISQAEGSHPDTADQQRFMKRLLNDLRALEAMLADSQFERAPRRIGAEQEFVLTDDRFQPAPRALDVLEELDNAQFTTELSRYNLEYNLSPMVFGGDCLAQLESGLQRAVDAVDSAAQKLDLRSILTGILPTLHKSDLTLQAITPHPRYRALATALRSLRGEDYEFRFTGADELTMRHSSVMLEACNTSFQLHYQVAPDEFARLFNITQLITAPVLAAAVNSPLLFGKRLWRETRIALFQQAVDQRRPVHEMDERAARVRFGEEWVRESVVEVFQQDISRFRSLICDAAGECPFESLARGSTPTLDALRLFNGTVYRWNRACYGVLNGVPHLRIENRVLPAGPTVIDQVANAAFWFGLIAGAAAEIDDVRTMMAFDTARTNFLLAARLGLDAPLRWVDGSKRSARELILEVLLPLARRGLHTAEIDAIDAKRYLDIVESRVDTGQTGAAWMLDSFETLRHRYSRGEATTMITAAMWRRQREAQPVHEWSIVESEEIAMRARNMIRVDQFMTTDVFSVRESDIIDLAACIMDWKHVRHVPVEDDAGHVVGIVSYRQLLRFLAKDLPHGRDHPVAVREVMAHDPVTVAPETSTVEAIRLMRDQRVPCLPVVKGDRLVGIVSERDFIDVASRLLEERLEAEG